MSSTSGRTTAAVDHRRDHRLLQPLGRACEPRDLLGRLGERASGAPALDAEPAPLGPHHLGGAGDRDVPDPLQSTGINPLSHHAALGAPGRIGRGHHPPTLFGQVDGVDDAKVGQVEDRARSIRATSPHRCHDAALSFTTNHGEPI